VQRVTLAQRLAELVDTLPPSRASVTFDGPDAAGKTTLADRVADLLPRPTVRVSIDGWHNPREVRMRRGDKSPEGYYHDSFDLQALLQRCLLPFQEGSRTLATALFDYRRDQQDEEEMTVPPGAVLLADGVFLQRPELRGLWNLVVYLHVPESVTLERALRRDLALFGSEDAVRQRYSQRYFPGQEIYRQDADPAAGADVLVDNSQPEAPVILRWAGTR
jgi:uridine kinase